MEKMGKTIIALGDGLRLALEVEAVSSQGLRLRSVDLRRARSFKLLSAEEWVLGQMRSLARSLRVHDEELQAVDYDPIRELGLLRSEPKAEAEWKEYFELSLDQGVRLVLRRYAYDRQQGRKRELGFGLTQEELLELVDQLGRTLREAPERSEAELAVQAA